MAEPWFWLAFGTTLGSALTILFFRMKNRRKPKRQWRPAAKAPATAQRVRKTTSPGVTRVTKARFKSRGRRSW